MFKTLKNAWGIPELRKKILFTLLILLLYRIGSAIAVPYVDTERLASYFSTNLSNTILGMFNALSGSGLSQGSVLALSIQPYINASIIIQLLTVAIPLFERWAKDEGEEGKKKINLLTRYTTVGLGLLMGWGYYMILASADSSSPILLSETGFLQAVVIILTFTAGSAIVMWLGEQITEFGIGNGISVILFAGIISGIPSMIRTLITGVQNWSAGRSPESYVVLHPAIVAAIVVGMVALVVFIVFINDAERRIPIQYAKRVVGRKIYGGQSTNMPMKVAMSGVMPVIFASSICSVPATIYTFAHGTEHWTYTYLFSPNSWAYFVVYGLMIFFFSWFYASIQYDPVEISNNLKRNGGFIPGFRPGKPTADFIKKVIAKIVIFGAVYLAIVAMLPILAGNLITSFNYLAIGGTSVIIVVGVALETVQALEAQMLMRHYKGFLD